MELETRVAGEWHEYILKDGGAEVAFARWRRVFGDAELHNRAVNGSIQLLKETRRIFREVILSDIREAGLRFVVVGDDVKNVDETRLKYWKFMGFEPLDEVVHGHACAVMEV